MNKIISSIYNNSKTNPNNIAICSGARKISYVELVKEIDKTADFLAKTGFKNLALLADNSPNWLIFDLACLKHNIILTPVPHFFTHNQIENLIQNAGIEAVICQNKFDFFEAEKLAISEEFSLVKTAQKIAVKIPPNTIKITFTSGTTGNPKGVCLGVEQIENIVFALIARIGKENIQNNLSILPLSILLENIAGAYISLVCGACAIIPHLEEIGISNSSTIDIKKFSLAINFYQPNSFILVPELAKILIHLAKSNQIKTDNFKFIAVGGSRISKDLIDEALKLKIPLYQGYGLSEFCSVVAVNSKENNLSGSVGKILPHLEIKIENDGEILLKGNKFLGYLGAEKEDLEEWYQTGDTGYLDQNNYLFINGRKKNIFITSMGRNVNPEWVESEIAKSNLIAQIAVYGEAKPFNVAIITPISAQISKENLKAEINQINQNLPDYAQIKEIILSQEPFSVQNNMLTGTGRIKRENIYQLYQSEINKIYEAF